MPKPIVFRPGSNRRADLRTLADEDLMSLVRTVSRGRSRSSSIGTVGPAFSLAYRMCGRRAMAEDVVQEAFMSLWRSGARYDSRRGSVRNWVLGVVHNRAIDAFRRGVVREGRNVSDEGLAERLPADEETATEVARRDEARQVRAKLQELPAEQRQVVELAYFGGFSHTQIAEMLKLPAGTVKGRMRLALTKMRIALGDPAGFVV